MGVAAIGIAGLALTAVSTAFAVYSGVQQQQAAKAEGEYTAAVARNNQTIANQAAERVAIRGQEQVADIRNRGRIAEGIKRQETRQLIGIQRAALAGSGVEVDTGSALDLTSDTAAVGEFEAQTVRAEAARNARQAGIIAEEQAYELRTRGVSYGAEADLAPLKAFQPDTSLTTALSGLGTIASRYGTLKQQGVFD